MPTFIAVVEKTIKELISYEIDGNDSLDALDKMRAKVSMYNEVSPNGTNYSVKSVEIIKENVNE